MKWTERLGLAALIALTVGIALLFIDHMGGDIQTDDPIPYRADYRRGPITGWKHYQAPVRVYPQ